MNRSLVLVVLAAVAWTAEARAADAPPPASSVDQNPSGAPPRPRREGFVASASLGPGFFSSQSGASPDKRRYVGTTLSLDVNLGGHIGRHFAFGAAYLRDQVYGLGVEDSLASVQSPSVKNLSFNLNLFALFGDVIVPFRGPELHLQGFFGYCRLGVTGRSANADVVNTPDGVAYAAAISGRLPLAGAVKVGLTARVTYAPLSVREYASQGTSVHVVVPALLATVGFD